MAAIIAEPSLARAQDTAVGAADYGGLRNVLAVGQTQMVNAATWRRTPR